MISENTALEKERQNLLIYIWKRRKVLMIISGTAAILALIISLLMTPIYRSTAIVFPAATSTVSFSEQRNAKAAAMDFGEEEQAEQLVQILSSSRIRNKIVQEFNLMKHYHIDSEDHNKYYKLVKMYNENFLFVRTRYGSIQIDVLDRDPKLAAVMANKIVDLIDTVKNQMVAERTWPAFEINKRKKEQLEKERDDLVHRMDTLSAMGVISPDGRTELFQAYVNARGEEKAEIKRIIDVNIKYGSTFDALDFSLKEKITQLESFKVSYEQAESDAYAVFNHKFVVEKAVVADKKDKPKRLIIILISTIGAFVFGLFTLLIKDRLNDLKKIS